MQRLSQEELNATYRIYNHVEELVGPYYGHKTHDDIEDFASLNRWIMFPKNGITNLREGTMYPLPNVFVSTDPLLEDDGAGRVNGWVGFTYHNVDAMLAFYEMLRRPSKKLALRNVLISLDTDWSIEIQRKTKTDFKESTPLYDTFKAFKSPEIFQEDVDLIKKAIIDSNKTLLQFGDDYPETGNPVLWSVTVFTVIKKTTVATFDADIKKAFDSFFRLLDIA